jgi:hypothetical protein
MFSATCTDAGKELEIDEGDLDREQNKLQTMFGEIQGSAKEMGEIQEILTCELDQFHDQLQAFVQKRNGQLKRKEGLFQSEQEQLQRREQELQRREQELQRREESIDLRDQELQSKQEAFELKKKALKRREKRFNKTNLLMQRQDEGSVFKDAAVNKRSLAEINNDVKKDSCSKEQPQEMESDVIPPFQKEDSESALTEMKRKKERKERKERKAQKRAKRELGDEIHTNKERGKECSEHQATMAGELLEVPSDDEPLAVSAMRFVSSNSACGKMSVGQMRKALRSMGKTDIAKTVRGVKKTREAYQKALEERAETLGCLNRKDQHENSITKIRSKISGGMLEAPSQESVQSAQESVQSAQESVQSAQESVQSAQESVQSERSAQEPVQSAPENVQSAQDCVQSAPENVQSAPEAGRAGAEDGEAPQVKEQVELPPEEDVHTMHSSAPPGFFAVWLQDKEKKQNGDLLGRFFLDNKKNINRFAAALFNVDGMKVEKWMVVRLVESKPEFTVAHQSLEPWEVSKYAYFTFSSPFAAAAAFYDDLGTESKREDHRAVLTEHYVTEAASRLSNTAIRALVDPKNEGVSRAREFSMYVMSDNLLVES